MAVNEDIATFLASEGVGVFDEENSNIFLGPLRPPKIVSDTVIIPERSSWVIITGGPEPSRVFSHSYRFHRAAIQVVVRGNPNQYLDSELWANEIWDTIEGAAITGYETILASQNGPVFLNFDENERAIWSLNFLCSYNVTV